MIAVVDSGGANLTSVLHALERLGATAELTADAETIRRADKVILPGVGAAARAMEMMRERGLVECLRERTRPTLGICLGMQLLFQSSQEGPTECLARLAGKVKKLEPREGLTIPHMGWNQIDKIAGDASPLLREIPQGTHFYFVHSYFAELGPYTSAACEYGLRFSACVEQGDVYGVQFHPERSGPAGARLLQNFLRL